jgi:hypothetical protein
MYAHQLWKLSLAVLLSAAVRSTLAAEPAATPTAAEKQAGHSQHGEIFNEGPRQKAYLMGNTGNVSLQITTKSPEAQAFFNQGLGQLHGFWYFEAERSFRQAAALDSDCAMAYWGMAMANRENEKRGKGFIDEAVKRKGTASAREQLWIDTLSAFFNAGADSKKLKPRRSSACRSGRTAVMTCRSTVMRPPTLCFAKCTQPTPCIRPTIIASTCGMAKSRNER